MLSEAHQSPLVSAYFAPRRHILTPKPAWSLSQWVFYGGPFGENLSTTKSKGVNIKHCGACPVQVKIEVGQVKLGSYLPDVASKYV